MLGRKRAQPYGIPRSPPRRYRARTKEKYSDDLQWTAGVVGGGGNSGFQAVNLAAQFGASRIILIGFDMTDRGGKHWYGRNHWPMSNNPTPPISIAGSQPSTRRPPFWPPSACRSSTLRQIPP
jgi:hypothetical protein